MMREEEGAKGCIKEGEGGGVGIPAAGAGVFPNVPSPTKIALWPKKGEGAGCIEPATITHVFPKQ